MTCETVVINRSLPPLNLLIMIRKRVKSWFPLPSFRDHAFAVPAILIDGMLAARGSEV